MYQAIIRCRICGNEELIPLMNLGMQTLTGVFPKTKDAVITQGPLELVKCHAYPEGSTCGLVQLRHSYDLNETYGMNYGYRSGLNPSMVRHLCSIVEKIKNIISFNPGDFVLDIGSNDGTLLRAFPSNLRLVGIDPTAKKFKDFYPEHVQVIPDFFSGDIIQKEFPSQKAKVVTAIAMVYDLESPLDFMSQVYSIMSDNGILIVEMSYLPTMMENNAYDTICHEHLEYYSLKQIKWMTDRTNFKIIDVELNNVNGGSFCIVLAKKHSSYPENAAKVRKLLDVEIKKGLDKIKTFIDFKDRVFLHRGKLHAFLQRAQKEGKKILGYGASTKGNVILQFCNISVDEIPYIAEINKDKFGRFTPGTFIPIISEEEAHAMNPDFFLVLPWHFEETIIQRERNYLNNGGHLVFPLPKIRVI